MKTALTIDGHSLTLQAVQEVAQTGRKVTLAASVKEPLEKARAVVENALSSGEIVYGVNTGFGYLKNTQIPAEDIRSLQRNLILSHACGVGQPFAREQVRAMMLLRANTLIQGHSGVRPIVVETLLACLNVGIHPQVPSQGSVGASGDLAPLSHLVLALLGEGQVEFRGTLWPAAQALAEAGIEPLVLEAKEGLALINGTQPMSAVACAVVSGMEKLLDQADLIAALSIQGALGSFQAFRKELHQLRPHPGQLLSAERIWKAMQNSDIVNSHADCDRVQDAYSFRCAPQVHGASRDSWNHIRQVVEREINSVTDNPLILPESNEIISCGHFHGQPIALVMDFAAIALAELANISERRIERLVNPQLNQGLPAFLTPREGLHSGFMIAQYTAASLVSENKVLAHPASVDSIPTSASQEDHVSMGTIAARKALQILEQTRQVLAIELLCACQALDLRAPIQPSPIAAQVLAQVRTQIPMLEADRYLAPDLEKASKLLAEGSLLKGLEDWLKA
ncbi:histidine ammonia-lyase [bacterium (Candidatus Blackallbacteria) CG17_big_fil_post_rev_8_21_14_2_50_48_46]|uniref:Histidine ammonia-lyase n=1 Tax=bacterium (Candidatus Blackallbacteria) CG17_big_fil_post_rev_8_21_14_2_50_48_46 TaxID=2014261 RepID=A0A2M7G0I8_9BACT|nr:MAG: histidine ammonia-lyase [bacterium (Candidatus Blackallbacteria) CG18_big_fil_WC_8_21_14_2_50_49_26]PIW15202.1 MAG: histidine ammonia-lyase [bacterium (Candidatus Blackallbacteria) CG17_big_fil_post_rev_8_21_14_2_50_48_46]PIW44789.1 MAG: histidine ammonia-lyase [bacterium (Candidatus Blackallbacteria) CG13_big_fil_rev_8_21_14_2_50_49_14]